RCKTAADTMGFELTMRASDIQHTLATVWDNRGLGYGEPAGSAYLLVPYDPDAPMKAYNAIPLTKAEWDKVRKKKMIHMCERLRVAVDDLMERMRTKMPNEDIPPFARLEPIKKEVDLATTREQKEYV